jgi:hypothetical protein
MMRSVLVSMCDSYNSSSAAFCIFARSVRYTATLGTPVVGRFIYVVLEGNHRPTSHFERLPKCLSRMLACSPKWSVLISQFAVKGIAYFITETASGLGD